MKKILSGILLSVLILTASPYISNAETRTSESTSTQRAALLSQIQALLQVIEKLQAQLALQKGNTTATDDSSLTVTSVLDTGSRGNSVLVLQNILLKLGYLKETPTGFFGPVTREALVKFQTANGLEPVGYTGPKTRELLNQQYKATFAKQSETPPAKPSNPETQRK
jgi:murein L,D-transpeptidase YcbB/YkuD